MNRDFTVDKFNKTIFNHEFNHMYLKGDFISVYTKDKMIINGTLVNVVKRRGNERITVMKEDSCKKTIPVCCISDICYCEED